MAFSYQRPHEKSKEESVRTFAAAKRLYATADKSRLVEEGDGKAAFLFCSPGDEMVGDAADRYLAYVGEVADAEPVLEADPDSEIPGTIEETDAEPDAGERRRSGGEAEEKAVDGPPEDKAVRKRRTKKAKE